MELRPDDIAEIVRIFNDSELVELRLEIGGSRLYLSKQAGGSAWESAAAALSAATAPAPAARGAAPAPTDAMEAATAPDASDADAAGGTTTAGGTTAAAVSNLVDLRSPLLGVFYRRPAPDKPAFVEVGAEVGADDPVCIIDVMKMFSRVPAGVAGRVAEILVQDGQLVEHGQVLMRLEPR